MLEIQQRMSHFVSAAFRELYSRTSNPARKFWIYNLWSPERRRVERLFKQFRLRMSQLLQEVCSIPYYLPAAFPAAPSLRCPRLPTLLL